MKEKVTASQLFKDKKESYAESVAQMFKENRLVESSQYKSLAKAKLDFVDGKKYLQSQDEKIIVSELD
jgi:hypothetical protein